MDVKRGPERLAGLTELARHRHRDAYAAVVLEGAYIEAGDGGRWRAEPGTVLVHGRYEAHANRIARGGCTLFNLPIAPDASGGAWGLADPDEFIRRVRDDPRATEAALSALGRAVGPAMQDWPDHLAATLRQHSRVRLAAWAAERGLTPESVSRGFRQVFGSSPSRYRLEVMTRRAIALIEGSEAQLAHLAGRCGFADQAHMTRSIRAMTGTTPGALRRGCQLRSRRVAVAT